MKIILFMKKLIKRKRKKKKRKNRLKKETKISKTLNSQMFSKQPGGSI